MNDRIRTIGLVGAGAVGSYIIWCFQGAPDTDFYLIAEGERAARLKSEGLLINGKRFRPAVRSAEELFSRTSLHCHFMEDIITDMWVKYCSNITNNLPQAILGVGSGAYQDSRYADWIRMTLEDEVIRVAAAEGIVLKPQGNLQGYKKSARYSTLQDLDAGRHTEADMFLGVLMRNAKAAGIQVPAAEYTWHLIKALEEKNDGLFDYSADE